MIGSLAGGSGSAKKLLWPCAASSGIVILPSRIAQSGYNAQTVVSEKLTLADSGAPLAIGVDIGGTAIKAAIVGLRGDLLQSFHEPSPRTVSALHDFVHSVLKCAKVPVWGIGIGCKGIIDAHGGQISIERTDPSGTVFAFTLPLEEA